MCLCIGQMSISVVFLSGLLYNFLLIHLLFANLDMHVTCSDYPPTLSYLGAHCYHIPFTQPLPQIHEVLFCDPFSFLKAICD